MKLYLFLILSICTTFNSLAQSNLRLTIEWNSTSSRYEVFALSATSQKNYVLGKSQISLVLPKSAPDVKLNVLSHVGGLWNNDKFILAPESSSENDYHSVSSSGGIISFTANQGLLLFSFTLADGVCRDGVRLYNNGSDPASTAKGFNNLDFNNSMVSVGNAQVYNSNVSNSGTKCMDCPVEFSVPKLKKQSE